MFLHLYQCICMFMQNYPLYWSSYRFSCLLCYPGILPLIINDQSFYRKCLKNVWMKIKSSWVTIHKWIWQCRNSLRRQTLRCVFRPIVKAGPPIHANSCQGKPPCPTFTTMSISATAVAPPERFSWSRNYGPLIDDLWVCQPVAKFGFYWWSSFIVMFSIF